MLFHLQMDVNIAELNTFSPVSALYAFMFHLHLHVLFLQLSPSQRNA